MIAPFVRRLAVSCALLSGFVTAVGAQTYVAGPRVAKPSPQTVTAAAVHRAAPGESSLAHADLTVKTRLAGHLPGWANAANDQGAAPADTVLHLDFVLTRPAAVQAAFDQLLSDQQTPGSPLFHSWLTPEQIGRLYGPAQADVDVLTAWLTAQGLRVDDVSPTRMVVHVSGPVAQVGPVLATDFRMYRVAGAGAGTDGKTYVAATAEPALPAALTSLVAGIAGLSQTPDEPQHRMTVVTAPAPDQAAGIRPAFTSSSSGNHYVAPGDFAVIYDLPAQTTSATDGTGQKIAVIGRSRVNPDDVTNFQASIGLPSKLPNVVIAATGGDPGLAGGGDQGEATLDVQRTLGSAPGAQTDLVIATNAAGGIKAAIQYNVNTLLDPVMTISFGACEANAGTANINLYAQLFSQAAAEGISVFVSSGDSGAAGCDTHSVAPPTTTQFLNINYICSSGFATCVGGTEFNDSANAATYWSSTNSATRTSALGYIPEGIWNEPTTVSGGVTSYTIGAGGGGASTFIAKPTWQVGTGVPNDGFRDTPDLSFTGAGHDGYFGCYASANGGDCVRNAQTGTFSFVSFAGTSASTPGMAAIAALLNQRAGAAQGNLNPLIYRLAASTSANAFRDTTVASSGVSGCTASVPSLCNNSTPSATALTGGLAGYVVTPGFDLASGWGSMDVANFFAAAVSTGSPTTTTATATGGSTVTLTATVKGVAAGTPTGTVQFFANGTAFGAVTPLVAGKATLTTANTLAVGSNSITASYSGDSNFQPSNSAPVLLTVLAGTAASATTVTVSPNPGTTLQLITLTARVTGSAGSTPNGTANFFYSVGTGPTNLLTSAALLNGVASTSFYFSATTWNFSASFSGDGTYAVSTSPVVPFVSTATPTSVAITGPATVAAGATATLGVSIGNLPTFPSSGSLVLYDGTTQLSSTLLGKPSGITQPYVTTVTTPALAAGIHSLTVAYTGDANALTSTSAPLIVVAGTPPGVTITPAASTLTLAAGSATGNSDALTLTSTAGFAGPVTLGCTVTYNGTATLTFAPTCSLTSGTVPLTSGGSGTSSVVIGTTVPHAIATVQHAALGNGRSAVWALLLGLLPLAAMRRQRAILRATMRTTLRTTRLVCLLTLLAGLAAVGGCGSGGSSATSTQAPVLVGTTKGSYTITVTATGSVSGYAVGTSSTIGLTVQ